MENSSSNLQTEPFYKYRGVTKCMSAGISFITDNFLNLVKLSMPYTTAFAIVFAAILYILSDSSLMQVLAGNAEASDMPIATLGVTLLVLLFIGFVIFSLLNGLIFRLLHVYSQDLPVNKDGYKLTLKYSLKYTQKFIVYYIVTGFIGSVLGLLPVLPLFIPTEGILYLGLKLAGCAVLFIIVIILALPFAISLPAMYFEKGNAFKNAVYGYKKGFKMIGKIFGLGVLLMILGYTLLGILALPSITLVNTYRAATLSVLNGDAANMPSGYGFWYAVVLFVTCYLASFWIWLSDAVYCYLYASMKVDEAEQANNKYAIA